MRFNSNCVRDILMTVEENTDYQIEMIYDSSSQFPRLSKYTVNEIMYHMQQCKINGLIIGFENILGGFQIKDLTQDGHTLIAKIRDDTVWNKISKTVISSIPVLIQIASEVYKLIYQ